MLCPSRVILGDLQANLFAPARLAIKSAIAANAPQPAVFSSSAGVNGSRYPLVPSSDRALDECRQLCGLRTNPVHAGSEMRCQ
jgi:hypothetical protein